LVGLRVDQWELMGLMKAVPLVKWMVGRKVEQLVEKKAVVWAD